MKPNELKMTYIGGPTALLEVGGLRLLTDPTFDPAGTAYPAGIYTLRKTAGPAVSVKALGRIDAVLLSHDHHFDNLDHAGRTFLSSATRVITTPIGAERLGGHAVGLAPWQSMDIPNTDGRILRVTGTPGRHGPVGGDRGPVMGFVLAFPDAPDEALYLSGDTVWYEGVAEVAQQFDIKMAVLFMGAARVREVGPEPLTMTAEDGVQAARAFPNAAIVPLHFADWEHFTEIRRDDIQRAFTAAGIPDRLHWLEPGITTTLQ